MPVFHDDALVPSPRNAKIPQNINVAIRIGANTVFQLTLLSLDDELLRRGVDLRTASPFGKTKAGNSGPEISV